MKTLLVLSALVAQSSAAVAVPVTLNANVHQKLKMAVGVENTINPRSFDLGKKNFDDYALTDLKATNRYIMDAYYFDQDQNVVVVANKQGEAILSIYGYKKSTYSETGKKVIVKVGTQNVRFVTPTIEVSTNVYIPSGTDYDLKNDVLNYHELAGLKFSLVNNVEGVDLTSDGVLIVDRLVPTETKVTIQVSATNTKSIGTIDAFTTFNNDFRSIMVNEGLTIKPSGTLQLRDMLANYDSLLNPVLKFNDNGTIHKGYKIINNTLVASSDVNVNPVYLVADADNAFRPIYFYTSLDATPTPKPDYVQIQQKGDLQIHFNQGLGIQDMVTNYNQLLEPKMSFDSFTDSAGFEIIDNVLCVKADAQKPSISVLVGAKNASSPAYITITAVDVKNQPIRLSQLNYTVVKGQVWTINKMIVNLHDLQGLKVEVVNDQAVGKMWYDNEFNLHVDQDVAQGAYVTVEITATNSQEHKLQKIYADTTIELETDVLRVERNHTYNFDDMVKNLNQLVDPGAVLGGYGIWDVDLFNSKGILTVGKDAYGTGTITISATNALKAVSFTMIVVVK